MRWDIVSPNEYEDPMNSTVVLDYGSLRLQDQHPQLCVDKGPKGTNLLLFACGQVTASTWTYDTAYGLFRYSANPSLCISVHTCVMRPDPGRSCIPTKGAVETNPANFVEGSVLLLDPCYDSADGKVYAMYRPAQTFTREVDCSAGCTPAMLQNGICDPLCNNLMCENDKGACQIIPTNAPSNNIYLTGSPVSSSPTPFGDSHFPTLSPTDPFIENDDINESDFFSYWWLLFLILLLCCLLTLLFGRKDRKRKSRRIVDDPDYDANLDETPIFVEEDPGINFGNNSYEDEKFKTGSTALFSQKKYDSRSKLGDPSSPNGLSEYDSSTFVSKRNKSKKVVDDDEVLVDVSGTVDDGSSNEDDRFKTGSAVALNQLRYHSRPTTHVPSENTSRASENSIKQNFEEVGLV